MLSAKHTLRDRPYPLWESNIGNYENRLGILRTTDRNSSHAIQPRYSPQTIDLIFTGFWSSPTHPVGAVREPPTLGTAQLETPQTPDDRTKIKPLGRLIGAFKSVSTRKINQIRKTPGTPIWQRNYYERIIRNERALHTIRQYIV